MRGWHISVVIMCVALSVLAVSLFYLRPIADQGISPLYSRWKILAILAIIAFMLGAVLLIIPERFWWNP